MNSAIPTLLITTLSAGSLFAGSVSTELSPTAPGAAGGWSRELSRPMTNPTLFDLAVPSTNLRPIFIHHLLPDTINTTAGELALGGDVQVYALQFEYAINDRFSLVATKDGFVDFNPDTTLTDESGFANLGGGVKYAFLLDPSAGHALSGSATFEFPTGNSDVLQGEGDGAANLVISGLKVIDDWQFAAGTGVTIPFSDDFSANSFLSLHASRKITPWFIPLAELNWYHVLDAGNGGNRFDGQAGGAVPGIVEFEGHDFFNLGAANADQNRDLVTAALGFRSQITESIQTGIAYEMPLTDDRDSVIEGRLTLDMFWTF